MADDDRVFELPSKPSHAHTASSSSFEPVRRRGNTASTADDDAIEPIDRAVHREPSRATIRFDDAVTLPPDVEGRRRTSLSLRTVSSREATGRFGKLRRFWRRQIAIRVPSEACRDHYANERTYLSWLRSSLALSNIGVIVAQLFRLQHGPPVKHMSFYSTGRPLAAVFIAVSPLVSVYGAWRFWQHQNAMARGKAITGGFPFHFMGFMCLALMIAMLGVILKVNEEYQ